MLTLASFVLCKLYTPDTQWFVYIVHIRLGSSRGKWSKYGIHRHTLSVLISKHMKEVSSNSHSKGVRQLWLNWLFGWITPPKTKTPKHPSEKWGYKVCPYQFISKVYDINDSIYLLLKGLQPSLTNLYEAIYRVFSCFFTPFITRLEGAHLEPHFRGCSVVAHIALSFARQFVMIKTWITQTACGPLGKPI